MAWYYTFEAKEIQSFILQSDKLREMVGGSELVAQLCGRLLDRALEAVGVQRPESVIVSTAAGWARMVFEDEGQAREFRKYWPMLVSRYAPGLKLIDALVPIRTNLPDAVKEAIDILRGARNMSESNLPELGPLVERAPRTGTTAVALVKDKKMGKPVPVDRQTIRKQQYAKTHSSLTQKISKNILVTAWPYELDDIVSDESAYVAVVHADGNDLGSMLMRIGEHIAKTPQDAEKIYRMISECIDRITVSAVQHATEKVLFPVYQAAGEKSFIPARPIVLGGDDLTIIVRADLAIEFTCEFLSAFERNSRAELAELRRMIQKFPEELTACAGVAFVKKSYPFVSAYHMAESLCDHTKRQAKQDRDSRKSGNPHPPVPSSFSFHRITTSMAEGFSEVKGQELTGRGCFKGEPVKFWYGPYAVGDVSGKLPQYNQLNSLVQSIAELPTGSIRTLISTMHTDPVSAVKDYQRVLQVASADKSENFHNALQALTANTEQQLWNADMQTPLADAHLLAGIVKGGNNA